jgi:hypothetical protein
MCGVKWLYVYVRIKYKVVLNLQLYHKMYNNSHKHYPLLSKKYVQVLWSIK